jgi:hypothetical protein
VSDHLRFTLDEYHAIRRACRSLELSGPFTAFQRHLEEALLAPQPALATRVAGLRSPQVRTLRRHMEDRKKQQSSQPAEPAEQVGCELSFREWRTVAQACAVIALRDDSLLNFKGRLLHEVAATDPGLAVRLARLGEGEVTTLYRRVKSGKRWCP